ncbi:hypothetical protein PVA38_12105 [Streptococcus pneumoniae D39]|nr:hypothetical protein PVA38_12105 [Streptococcus pneumoniae D39]
MLHSCLLYTSDAADEARSVDLGGRRIIKKKTTMQHIELVMISHTSTIGSSVHGVERRLV